MIVLLEEGVVVEQAIDHFLNLEVVLLLKLGDRDNRGPPSPRDRSFGDSRGHKGIYREDRSDRYPRDERPYYDDRGSRQDRGSRFDGPSRNDFERSNLRGGSLRDVREMALAPGEQKIIQIPAVHVGLIIGKRGETVRDITERTGATIYISRDEEMPAGAPMRDVTIKGNEQQRRAAERMIEDLLAAKEASQQGCLGNLQIDCSPRQLVPTYTPCKGLLDLFLVNPHTSPSQIFPPIPTSHNNFPKIHAIHPEDNLILLRDSSTPENSLIPEDSSILEDNSVLNLIFLGQPQGRSLAKPEV